MIVNRQFIGFVFVSSIAAGVNFLSRILLNYEFGYTVSIIGAFIFGLTTAFILNKILIFKSAKSSVLKSFILFFLVNLLALIIIISVSLSLNDYILPFIGWDWYRAEVAHFIGIASPVFTSYYLHKRFTFG